MNRKAVVYNHGKRAGLLEEVPGGYTFAYAPDYLANSSLPSISLTLPKRGEPYRSAVLFPFFFGLLAEGVNRGLQCRRWQIDEKDYFGLLLATARYDTVGSVTLKPLGDGT